MRKEREEDKSKISTDQDQQKDLLLAVLWKLSCTGYIKEATFPGALCVFRSFGGDLLLFPPTSYQKRQQYTYRELIALKAFLLYFQMEKRVEVEILKDDLRIVLLVESGC